jgi:hypothetical protein
VPAEIVSNRPILSPERMLYKDFDRKSSVEKKILFVFGGKLPVVK